MINLMVWPTCCWCRWAVCCICRSRTSRGCCRPPWRDRGTSSPGAGRCPSCCPGPITAEYRDSGPMRGQYYLGLVGGAAVIVPDGKLLHVRGFLVQGLGLAPKSLASPVNPDVEGLHPAPIPHQYCEYQLIIGQCSIWALRFWKLKKKVANHPSKNGQILTIWTSLMSLCIFMTCMKAKLVPYVGRR